MKLKGFLTGFFLFALFVILFAGATNFDRLVLGSGNYGTDPNSSADITLQNDEYIDNSTDGTIDFGSANLATTGALTLASMVVDSGSTVGVETFTTTATADTVLISGALATDIYIVTGRGGSVDQQDVLQAEAKADTLIVHRLASGASGLGYNWFRFTYN